MPKNIKGERPMIIDLINYYPDKDEEGNQMPRGSLHVIIRFPDTTINVRGIRVRQEGKWIFRMPLKSGVCPKTGAPTLYPVLTFSNRGHQAHLLQELRERGPSFVERILEEQKCPTSANCQSSDAEALVDAGNGSSGPENNGAERASELVQQSAHSVKVKPKIFSDPPRPTASARRQSKFVKN